MRVECRSTLLLLAVLFSAPIANTIDLAGNLPGLPAGTSEDASKNSSLDKEDNDRGLHVSFGRSGLPVEIISRQALVRADRRRGGTYDFPGAVRKFAVLRRALFGLRATNDFPDVVVESVRNVKPSGVPDDGSKPSLHLVEMQISARGIPVLEGRILAVFADATLHSLRGEISSRHTLIEHFGSLDFSKLLSRKGVLQTLKKRIRQKQQVAGEDWHGITRRMRLVLDVENRCAAYVVWHQGTRYKINALSGNIYSEESYEASPAWEQVEKARITALSVAENGPLSLDQSAASIAAHLSVFPNNLMDRRVTKWIQLTTGRVPVECQFRLTYGAGEGSESVFAFPTLHPGDTFSTIETRKASCYSDPYMVQPVEGVTDPQRTRRQLAYQNVYFYTSSAARTALWNRPAALYAWLAPRNQYRLHTKVVTPDSNGQAGCASKACYNYGTHTIRIVDNIIYNRMTLHEYGHYVHHTYLPGNFFQASCLRDAVSEGIADALRESLLWSLRQDVPSDAKFMDERSSTPTRADVVKAISSTPCWQPYGDGHAISEILWAFLNDRYCSFDDSASDSEPCRIGRIAGDSRLQTTPVDNWGRESLTQAMFYSGMWASASSPPTPYRFVSDMGYWFKVLSAVYGVIPQDEWSKIRQVFLIHGVDIGEFAP